MVTPHTTSYEYTRPQATFAMVKTEAAKNRAVARAEKGKSKALLVDMEEACVNDAASRRVERAIAPNATTSQCKSVPYFPKTVVGAAAQADKPTPEPARPSVVEDEIPEDWEDLEGLVTKERDDMARCYRVETVDVGSGYKGLASALQREGYTHCLAPAALMCDVGRYVPAEYLVDSFENGITANSYNAVTHTQVSVCPHRLRECTCRALSPPEDTRLLGIADESIYYLEDVDLARFSRGDRLIARFRVGNVDVKRTSGGVEFRKQKNGPTLCRTWRKDKPWLDYYHVAGFEFLNGIVVHPVARIFAYPKILGVKNGIATAVFHFTNQRLNWGELDAAEILSCSEAKRRWNECIPEPRATSCDTNSQPPRRVKDDLAGASIVGEQLKTAADSLTGKPSGSSDGGSSSSGSTSAASPAGSKGPGVSVTSTPPTSPPAPSAPPPPPAANAGKAGAAAGGKASTEQDVRNYVRVRLTSGGLSTGTKYLAEVASSTQRRFEKESSDTISRLIREELEEVRASQLQLAKVATRDLNVTGVIAGTAGPTLTDRVLTSINPFGSLGSGRAARSIYNKHLVLPTKQRKMRVNLADSVMEAGEEIVVA